MPLLFALAGAASANATPAAEGGGTSEAEVAEADCECVDECADRRASMRAWLAEVEDAQSALWLTLAHLDRDYGGLRASLKTVSYLYWRTFEDIREAELPDGVPGRLFRALRPADQHLDNAVESMNDGRRHRANVVGLFDDAEGAIARARGYLDACPPRFGSAAAELNFAVDSHAAAAPEADLAAAHNTVAYGEIGSARDIVQAVQADLQALLRVH
ncbi:MAG: hypothetical protein H6704_01905 [Myxococcales bacterium]|nr:hypothetical protein [Myxococcales bacterium]